MASNPQINRVPVSVTKPRTRCDRCHKQQKKCDQARPTCDRCVKASAICVYSDTSTLVRIMDAVDCGPTLLNFNNPQNHAANTLQLIDPDFAATYNDYHLVKRLFESDLFDFNEVLFPVSLDDFLDRFFVMPPYLRAAACALAVSKLFVEFPELLLIRYFRQAKKFVEQHRSKPTLEMLQAIRIMGELAEGTGQIQYGQKLFEMEIHLYFRLRLNLDPDDPTTLYHRVPDQQKEWQRYVYHIAASYQKDLKLSGLLSPTMAKIHFDVSSVKLPKRLQNTGFLELSQGCDTLFRVKNHFTKPPANMMDLIVSPDLTILTQECMQFIAQVPEEHILVSTTDGYERFRLQLLKEPSWVHFYNMILLSMRCLTVLCMLHRPQVYLLAYLCRQSSVLSDSNILSQLLHALKQATEAAQCVANLTSFILQAMSDPTVIGGKNGGTSGGAKLSSHSFIHAHSGLDVFDAAIMLWFALCHVPRVWQDQISLNRVEASKGLYSILQFVHLVDSNMKAGNSTQDDSASPSVLSPIVLCINAFALEVSGISGPALGIHSLELAMTVMSMSDESDDLQPIAIGQEPMAYLGLLGVSVMGGVIWTSPTEPLWAIFWKNVQIIK